MSNHIPFNKPFMSGSELLNITKAYQLGQLAGDGPFTKLCGEYLEHFTKTKRALLTHSCTAALEMAALLLDVQPGDEIIMPSYTFVSTANAVVLRGGIPVFIDIRQDTLNLDESTIEGAITSRTKAIFPVHYAGVACEMSRIMEISKIYNLHVVEDAAQAIDSYYEERPLGSFGTFGAFSFHETKNISAGEGGALLINDGKFITRAEIMREKGTNRKLFIRGDVDKYTWVDHGSSFLPGELTAAFLWAQLEIAASITRKRLSSWAFYHDSLKDAEDKGLLRRPIIPWNCKHNAHLYYVLLPESVSRDVVIGEMKKRGIQATFHYVPLHSSIGGLKYGRAVGDLSVTEKVSKQLLRLPLFADITLGQQDRVISSLIEIITNQSFTNYS